MWGHPLEKMRQIVTNRTGQGTGPNGTEAERSGGIDGLYVISRRGLWGLFLFLAFSALALAVKSGTPEGLPLPAKELLGAAPPLMLMDLIFAVSTLSSLLIIAGPLHSGGRPGRTWPHVAFRVFFYLLYFCTDSLGARFDAVFISGIVVLALQHYSLWRYTTAAIEAKTGHPDVSSLHGVK